MLPPTQPTKLQFAALPIVCFVLLTTSALLKTLLSSSTLTREKGLVVLGKAVGAFMIVLGIIMIGARMVWYDTESMPNGGGMGSKHGTAASKATNRWDEGAKRTSDDVVEKGDGCKEDKKIRKMLVRAFKPNKAALLSGRKEEALEIVGI